MKVESFHVYRLPGGKFGGSAKVYVGDLIVEVPLDNAHAEAAIVEAQTFWTETVHEQAKAVVRGAMEAAR